MVFNFIWIGFFVVGFIVALIKLVGGDHGIMSEIATQVMDMAKVCVMDLSLPLVGVMAFWLGIMKVGQDAGIVNVIAKRVSPFFSKLFKGVPENHESNSHIVMNFSANMLGLDNAATPMGIRAMEGLQSLNKEKGTATDAMIMFLVLNTSGLTLIPTSIIALRAAAGAETPTDVFLPILIATTIASLCGLLFTCSSQGIKFWEGTLGKWLGIFIGCLGLTIWGLSSLDKSQLEMVSTIATGVIIMGIVCFFLVLAAIKRVNAYASFVDGAVDGFKVAIKIIPYLIAILCAIAVFRASGAFDYVSDGLADFFGLFASDTRFTEGIPTALMKPLSGSGARGMMVESWGAKQQYVDSFGGKLTSILQGSTETTFYVLAVYFGAVGVKNTRNALVLGLLADLAGIVAAICMAYLFFG